MACLLLLLTLLAPSGGCYWNRWFRRNVTEPSPVAFTTIPVREEVLQAINANSGRITSLQTQGATVSIPGVPSITADIAIERPHKFRFRAGTSLLGPELDLGSNDELFWFWAQRAPQSSVFFARHDQFATSRAKQMIPIEPSWLMEALGVVEIDPNSVIEGPVTAGSDRVQMKTLVHTSGGQFTRLLHIHKTYGWVLEQHLYDGGGQLVASARASQHQYYPLDGISLPQQVDITVPASGLQFQLVVDRYAVNQPLGDSVALFNLPRKQLQSYPFVDLADPNFIPTLGPLPTSSSSTTTRLPDPGPEMPQARYRGFSQTR
jgi:hypothetical protein